MRPKRSRQASNARSTSARLRHVALHAEAGLAQRPPPPRAPVAVDLGDHDARALAREALRHRAAEPAAAAGDERDAAGEPFRPGHARPPRSRSTSTRRSSLPEADFGMASISSHARTCMCGATRAAT